jgi:hypothetical protein
MGRGEFLFTSHLQSKGVMPTGANIRPREDNRKVKVKVSSPITGLDRPSGFQEDEVPRFTDNRHMKVVGCQPYAPAAFTPQERFLGTHFC